MPNFVSQIHETAMAADAARWQQYFRDAPPQPGDEQVDGWSHAQLVRMDNRFHARLLRAFKRGKENRQVATATYTQRVAASAPNPSPLSARRPT